MFPVTRVLFAMFVAVPMVQAATPMAPPVLIQCPAGSLTLTMIMREKTLPPGWSTSGLPVTFLKARTEVFSGKQVLMCDYGYPAASPSYPLVTLTATVPIDSCAVTDGRVFTCKAGTAIKLF
jgi:hypothetical protein